MSKEEYKEATKIPDLYDLLGLTKEVCKQPDCSEQIEKAYKKKAKQYHPDKYPDKPEMHEVFLLLTEAYNILSDPKLREEYNFKQLLSKQSSGNFFKLKEQSKSYIESIGEYKPATEQQKLSFKDQMKVLDSKHGYDATLEGSIDKREARKRMDTMNKTRAMQDIEFKQERLFSDGTFDPAKFNAAFDMVHKREEGGVVLHNGVPSAWNDMGAVANFSTFDNLENLYVDDNNHFGIDNQIHGSVNIGSAPNTKLTAEQIATLKGADYFSKHSDLSEDYYRDMKTRLRTREQEAGTIEKMKYGDFKRDDFAGYGIHDQIGISVDDKLTFDDDENISSKLERLKMERELDPFVNGGSNGLNGKKKAITSGR